MKKQVVVALFAAMFLFALSFVSAWSWDDTRSFFAEFVGSMPEVLWVKWLFFFLVFLVVFGISEVIPFFETKGIASFIFSVIVAVLAVFFLDSPQIYASLISYKALGITLTGIVPFLFMLFLSYKCFKKKEPIVAKVLWIAFIVSLLWVIGNGFTGERPEGNYGFIYVVVLVLSLLMLLFEGKLHAWWYGAEIGRAIADADTKVKREALIKILELEAKKVTIGSVAGAAAIDVEIKDLKKIAKIK